VWRPFRKSSPAASADEAWWRDASGVADAPTSAAIDALEQRSTIDRSEDVDADRQREMIAGLRQLAEVALAPDLPTMATQHRVIGADACHFIAPASRVAGAGNDGVVVTGVDSSGVAAEHGFTTGDVILEVAGKSVSSPAEVRDAIASVHSEGKRTVLMRVKKGGGTRFVALPVGNG
jgi:hypothetical protein